MKTLFGLASMLLPLAGFCAQARAVAATDASSLAATRDRLVLECFEVDADPHGDRGYHHVIVAYVSGRLTASVYLESDERARLLKRTGVLRRNAGNGYDTAFVGRELKVLVQDDSDEGLLELGAAPRVKRVELSCE